MNSERAKAGNLRRCSRWRKKNGAHYRSYMRAYMKERRTARVLTG
jgi:hypothetical protein